MEESLDTSSKKSGETLIADPQKSVLETVIQHLPVGVSITDCRTGRALFYNQTADKLVQRRVSERTSLEDYASYGAIHSDGTPYKVDEYPTTRAVKNGERIVDEPMLYKLQDGSLRRFSVSSVPVYDETGVRTLVVTTTQDVTERVWAQQSAASLRESEDRFKKIFDSNLIGIIFADINGRLYDVNDYYANLIGGKREDVLAGKVRWDLFTPAEDRLKDAAAVAEMRASKDGVCSPYQKRYILKDGTTKWVEIGVKFIDEERSRTLAYVLDITRRKDAELQLQQTLDRLKEAIQSRDEEKNLREKFVMSLSHDLRTPLNAAKMASELLQEQCAENHEAEELCGMVVRNLNRADEMIRDLLDANRINAGEKIPITIAKCDLKKVAEEALIDLRLLHGDRFVLNAPTSIHGFWSCSGLRRVIENLCGNAVKYGAANTPITVSLGHFGTRVEIQVHNEGSPVSEKDQATLFEMFRRTESAQRSLQTGWGIGLMLVKGLAEAHGGTVSVASDAYRGTTFTVSLPMDGRQHIG